MKRKYLNNEEIKIELEKIGVKCDWGDNIIAPDGYKKMKGDDIAELFFPDGNMLINFPIYFGFGINSLEEYGVKLSDGNIGREKFFVIISKVNGDETYINKCPLFGRSSKGFIGGVLSDFLYDHNSSFDCFVAIKRYEERKQLLYESRRFK